MPPSTAIPERYTAQGVFGQIIDPLTVVKIDMSLEMSWLTMSDVLVVASPAG